MRLFCTGICGRLGRALVALVAETGDEVVGIDRIPWPQDRPLPSHVRVEVADYSDQAATEPLLAGCDVLVHTAGPNGSHVRTQSLGEFIDLNVTAVATLLELAKKLGVGHAVLSSTMEVVIGRDWDASGIAVIDESAPPAADSQYALSRLLMEQMARQFCIWQDYSAVSLRYMAFGYSKYQDLGPHLLARSLTPRDVARSVLAAARLRGQRGSVFHIGPDSPLTNFDLSRALKSPGDVVERHFPGANVILERVGKPVRLDHLWPVTRIDKAREIMGWTPQQTFRTWLSEHGWQDPGAERT